jgi:hypothetical protein
LHAARSLPGIQKNSKWLVALRELVDAREHVVERLEPHPLGELVRRAHRHGELADHACCAEREPCELEQLGLAPRVALGDLAAREHDARGEHARGEIAQLPPGAVRAGRDRARDRLAIDVALVVQRDGLRRAAARRAR